MGEASSSEVEQVLGGCCSGDEVRMMGLMVEGELRSANAVLVCYVTGRMIKGCLVSRIVGTKVRGVSLVRWLEYAASAESV